MYWVSSRAIKKEKNVSQNLKVDYLKAKIGLN